MARRRSRSWGSRFIDMSPIDGRSRRAAPLGVSLALVTLAAMIAHPAWAAGEAAPDGPPAAQSAGFSPAQLEQLVAPIALYPDALTVQVLMAATYPLEI